MNNYMSKEKLNKLHEIQIELLDEVVKICKKNNLHYFLIGGTLLGAVRHQGFIPWDDDLDIAMPREDYEKFLNVALNHLDSKYFVDNFNTNKSYYLNFTKIRKKNTLFVQNFEEYYNGPKEIWIDIFPLDNLKKEKGIFQDMRIKVIKCLRSIAHYRMGFFLGNKKICIKKFVGTIFKPISSSSMMKIADNLMKKGYKKDSKYFINIASQYNFHKQTISKTKFFPIKMLQFEGKEYFVPNDYDYVLKRIYNDYMVLPPLEKRITHNPKVLSFDTTKE